jgi:lactose/L-arabinose transport system permease protein
VSGAAGGRNPAATLSRTLVVVVLVVGAIVSLYPFYAMAVFSTHSTADMFASPPPLLPDGQLLENFARLQEEVGFARVVVNSVVIATIYTLFGCLVSTLAGYGLAKHRFRGRQIVFGLILATMFIPYQVTLVPLFQLMSALKWVNSIQAVILPFLASAFGIFLMRQGFLSFPDEIIESGRMDGAGELRIFWGLVLPAVRPQLAALVIYTFMTQWSAFIWPLLMLSKEEQYTIPVALNTLIGQSHVDYAGLMLGSLVATLPMLVIFLVFQRQFISGLLGGAVKG